MLPAGTVKPVLAAGTIIADRARRDVHAGLRHARCERVVIGGPDSAGTSPRPGRMRTPPTRPATAPETPATRTASGMRHRRACVRWAPERVTDPDGRRIVHERHRVHHRLRRDPYNGEQWRIGALAREDRLDFQYSTDATSLITGTWTNLDILDFVAPTTTGAIGPLDGNAAANRTAKSGSISGLTLAAGSSIWIRWTDFNPAGSDDGLAVDDFTLTASAAPPGDDAPSVVSTTPANGAIDVPNNAPIRITFSEPSSSTQRLRSSPARRRPSRRPPTRPTARPLRVRLHPAAARRCHVHLHSRRREGPRRRYERSAGHDGHRPHGQLHRRDPHRHQHRREDQPGLRRRRQRRRRLPERLHRAVQPQRSGRLGRRLVRPVRVGGGTGLGPSRLSPGPSPPASTT